MTDHWTDRIAQLRFSPAGAESAVRVYRNVERRFHQQFSGSTAPRAWWVPGRIEVLGKHTDYGGGRSLLCTMERGFHLLAAPAREPIIRMLDAASGASCTIPLAADAPLHPSHWSDYPTSVARRIARDFPGSGTGADIVVQSTLPSASGLSSSSALLIATFLPLAEFNHLRATGRWQSALPDNNALAGYLGAVENGKSFGPFHADHGVGTHGGSEDQTAILCSRPGELSQYHFLPVVHEGAVPLPPGYTFAVAMSGVHAAKGGEAQQRYNHLAGQLAEMLDLWRTAVETNTGSLFAALQSAPDAATRLITLLERHSSRATDLLARLSQFRAESEQIIPAVTECLRRNDVAAIGPLVDESQQLAESILGNQIAETVHLARSARRLGAVAASAFGAGFGGSTWALVPATGAADFLGSWRQDYLERFPEHARRADFFLTAPAAAAQEL